MRILTGADVPKDPNAGASGTVYQTNRALRALGHEVDEIWAHDLPRRIAHGNLHYLLELPGRYRDAVRKHCTAMTYDVIQLSQPHAYLAARDHQCSQRPGIFVIRSHGMEQKVRQTLIEHGAMPSGANPARKLASSLMAHLLQRHARLAGAYADGMIVPCTDDRDFLVDHFGVSPERIAVIWHAPPDEFVASPPKSFTRARLNRLLYVGQFVPFKAPRLVAQAANVVLTRIGAATMTWVCRRSDHDRVRALLHPAILGRVELLEWQTQSHLMDIYDTHGTFLFPSYAEGAGKACLEAMSRRLCVVATNTSGMRDYIRDGSTGRLVEVGNTADFTAAVLNVLSDFPRSREIAEAARAQSRKYTWERCGGQAVRFYQQLIKNKTGRKISE